MTNMYTLQEADAGLMTAIISLVLLLEQRGVLNRLELADLLEGLTPPNPNDATFTPGLKAFLNILAGALRDPNLEKLPPGIKMVRF